jgi:hypothetical protein
MIGDKIEEDTVKLKSLIFFLALRSPLFLVENFLGT